MFVYLPHGHIFWMLYGSFRALHKALDVGHTYSKHAHEWKGEGKVSIPVKVSILPIIEFYWLLEFSGEESVRRLRILRGKCNTDATAILPPGNINSF